MITNRRGIIGAFAGMLVAPAVVRADSIMRVCSITPTADWMERVLNAGGTINGRFLQPERTVWITGDGCSLLNSTIRLENDMWINVACNDGTFENLLMVVDWDRPAVGYMS